MPVEIIVQQVSPIIGPLNPAFNTYAFAAPGGVAEVPELAARCVMYSYFSAVSCGTARSVSALSYRLLTTGSPPGPTIPIPYPVAEAQALFDDVIPAVQALIGPRADLNFGHLVGTGSPTIRGASICVNEVPANALIRGGRHYVPFVDTIAVDANGLFEIDGQVRQRLAYRGTFLGDSAAGGYFTTTPADVLPVIWSRKLLGFTDVTDVRVTQTISRLRTRLR